MNEIHDCDQEWLRHETGEYIFGLITEMYGSSKKTNHYTSSKRVKTLNGTFDLNEVWDYVLSSMAVIYAATWWSLINNSAINESKRIIISKQGAQEIMKEAKIVRDVKRRIRKTVNEQLKKKEHK